MQYSERLESLRISAAKDEIAPHEAISIIENKRQLESTLADDDVYTTYYAFTRDGFEIRSRPGD